MEDHKGQVLVSSEKQFVYRDATNLGHVQVPRMVVNCLKLSATAKIVYGVISGYVYEQGRSAFPSTSRIAMNACITKKTAIKYIDELVDKGFIIKKRHGNRRTNDYYLLDADKVQHLKVSEMFHSAFKKAVRSMGDAMYENLFSSMTDLLEAIGDVEFKDIPVSAATEKELVAALTRVSEEEEEVFKPPNQNSAVPVAGTPSEDKPLGGTVKKVGSLGSFGITRDPSNDVSKWKTPDFVQYFYSRYDRAAGRPHEAVGGKHRGMISRILRGLDNDQTLMKKYIDAFFELGYENQSLEWFSTSNRIEEIKNYLQTGKKPYYLTVKKPEVQDVPEQSTSGLSPEAFLQRIRGGKQ